MDSRLKNIGEKLRSDEFEVMKSGLVDFKHWTYDYETFTTDLQILTPTPTTLDFYEILESFKTMQYKYSSYIGLWFACEFMRLDENKKLKESILSISLKDVVLREIPTNLGSLTSLVELSLSQCSLERLPDWLGTMTQILELDLSKNRIKVLPRTFNLLKNLKNLDLSGNLLTFIPNSIVRGWKNLTVLDISFNNIKHLSPEFFELRGLFKLIAKSNAISSMEIPPHPECAIYELNLTNNEIKQLPENFESLEITYLDLSYNQLETIPPEVVSLKGLISLNLCGNCLRRFPETFQKVKLKILNISHNQIFEITEDIEDFPELSVLSAHHNELRDLPDEILALSELEVLNLGNNEIENLSTGIFSLTLKDLLLENNNLTSIFPIDFSKIENLNISGNPVSEIPHVYKATQLVWLNISNTHISELSSEIGNLKNLTHLSIEKTQIVELPLEMKNLKNLKEFHLTPQIDPKSPVYQHFDTLGCIFIQNP